MKPICFTTDDPGAVLIAFVMLVLALFGLAAGARILAYSWALVDRRFLYMSRSQRFFGGLFGVAISLCMIALMLLFLIERPICTPAE